MDILLGSTAHLSVPQDPCWRILHGRLQVCGRICMLEQVLAEPPVRTWLEHHHLHQATVHSSQPAACSQRVADMQRVPQVFLHPASALHKTAPQWVAWSQLVQTDKRIYMAGEPLSIPLALFSSCHSACLSLAYIFPDCRIRRLPQQILL